MANLRNFTPHVINLIKKEDLVGEYKDFAERKCESAVEKWQGDC